MMAVKVAHKEEAQGQGAGKNPRRGISKKSCMGSSPEGYGGHTLEMLKCLESKGHIYALDADPIELAKTTERLQSLGYGLDILTTIM